MSTRQLLRLGLITAALAGLGVVAIPWAWERVFPAPADEGAGLGPVDDLDRTIDAVQEQIALDLRAVGVGPGDIALTHSEERRRGDRAWTFTRTTVDLADEPPEAELRAAFAAWPEGVEAFVTRPDELTWSVRVYAGTHAVHQVLLRLPLDPAPAVDPAAPPRLAVVLTGLGERSEDAERWIASPHPLTLALQPYVSHTMRYATDAARSAKEVAVQLRFADGEGPDAPAPDDPLGMALPPALGLAMEPDALRARLDEDLGAVPYASGAVLRQGPPATRDAAAMEQLAGALGARDGYLLDEGGGGDGVALEMALRQGIPAGAAAVRLRPDADAEEAARDLLRAQNLAALRGHALVCVPLAAAGPADLAAYLEARAAEGYRLVFASELIEDGDTAPRK